MFEPQEMWNRVCERYAGCDSYRDEGVVSTTFWKPAPRVERKWFSTRFVRGEGFRFEFRCRRGEEHFDQYAIWLESGRVRTWWSLNAGELGRETLASAVAAATGVSCGSAYRVPCLLMPELSVGSVKRTWAWAAVESAEADAMGCVVLSRKRTPDWLEQYWLSRRTQLVQRVVEPRRALPPIPPEAIDMVRKRDVAQGEELARRAAELSAGPPNEVETVTTYDAAFDIQIPAEELVFTPADATSLWQT